MILPLYLSLSALCAAPIAWCERRRMIRAGMGQRLQERLGHASTVRPDGLLVWFNAASVGESLSVLRVIEELRARNIPVLLTTTTATAAKLAERRLPEEAIHQFAPLDTPSAIRRFMAYWRPDMAVHVESEIWPRQMLRLAKNQVPQILLNGRISEKSLRKWQTYPRTARRIFGLYAEIFTQTEDLATSIGALLGDNTHITCTGDLKASAAPLPVDEVALTVLQAQTQNRSIWAAVSTHPGEEDTITNAHEAAFLSNTHRLLILAPRHPERGDHICAKLREQGWNVAQRTHHEAIGAETQIYVADTLGELGLWYSIADFVFIGGSLDPIGGHNPFEAIPFGLPIITGPHHETFKAAYATLAAHGAAICLTQASQAMLTESLRQLDHPEHIAHMRQAMTQIPKPDPNLPCTLATRIIDIMEDNRP